MQADEAEVAVAEWEGRRADDGDELRSEGRADRGWWCRVQRYCTHRTLIHPLRWTRTTATADPIHWASPVPGLDSGPS